MKKLLPFLIFLPLMLRAQTIYNLNTVAFGVDPVSFPSIVRAAGGTDWATMEPRRDVYNFYAIDSYIAQAKRNNSSVLHTALYVPTWANATTNKYTEPTDLFTPALCPLGGSPTIPVTDCMYREYVTKLMQHVCGDLTAQPAAPLVGVCSIKYWEGYNELNANQYWSAPYSHLAIMLNDEASTVRTYCGDCRIIGGSVSAGGDGYNPAGGSGSFDQALVALLTAWAALPAPSLPDYVSIHTYPARTNILPAPFPTTIASNSDPQCIGTPNQSCRVAIKDQVALTKGPTVLCSPAIASWACGLPVYITEGGYGLNSEMQDAENGSVSGSGTVETFTSINPLPVTWITGTIVSVLKAGALNTTLASIIVTAPNAFIFAGAAKGTSSTGVAINADPTQTWVLRQAYVAQWMLTLAAQAPAEAMWYGYSEPCWGTMEGTGIAGVACPTEPILAAGFTANHVAYAQVEQWLKDSTSIQALTATPAGAETIWTMDATYRGLPARFAWYTGWLGSIAYPTTFTDQQMLSGWSKGTGGSVILTQQPMLLTSPPAPKCYAVNVVPC